MTTAATERPRVVLLCCDGAWQRALANRLAVEAWLTGIVLYRPPAETSIAARLVRWLARPGELLRHARARVHSWRCQGRSGGPGAAGDRFPAGVPVIEVPDINAPPTASFIQAHSPDLVCVNGTNLLRAPVRAACANVPLGVLNLHTGLSPYARGGNCNLFMLLAGRPEFVGVTVHYIDGGIDRGDIVLSARPQLRADDSVDAIDGRVFSLGIDLTSRAIRHLQEGTARRVPQWEKGTLFLRRTGHVYSPELKQRADELIGQGLIENYLARKAERDAAVRTVE